MAENPLIFVSYHPGSLLDFETIRRAAEPRETVLLAARHPYVTDEMIKLFTNRFSKVFVLPDIAYSPNLVSGFSQCGHFAREFDSIALGLAVDPALRLNVISDCSAYLPVNLLLSECRRRWGKSRLIAIRDDYAFTHVADPVRTAIARLYAWSFKLFPVYYHPIYAYKYITEPGEAIIRFSSPFDPDIAVGTKESISIRMPLRPHAPPETRDMVLVFSDRQRGALKCTISDEEYKRRLRFFFRLLAEHYKGCVIVCKPHPADKGVVMDELEGMGFDLYAGGLTSQMFIERHIDRIRACYAAVSSSLLYSSSRGIPSYSFYRYLDFDCEYFGRFFEDESARRNPFLLNLREPAAIGSIDSCQVPGGAFPEPDMTSLLR